jgi:hypothetical protein
MERESYWLDIFQEQKAEIDVNIFLLMRELQLICIFSFYIIEKNRWRLIKILFGMIVF